MEASIADDGEMLLRGPLLFRGYHNRSKKTAEVMDADGWFHTGDVAQQDEDGYLTITDRKKDLMKTSSGKYVAPQKVENAITANIPYISQAVAPGRTAGTWWRCSPWTGRPCSSGATTTATPMSSYEELTRLPEVRASPDRFVRRPTMTSWNAGRP